MMRVAMLIWSFWPEAEGGSERQCRLLADALGEHGVEVTILTARTRVFGQEQGTDGGSLRVLRFGRLCPFEKGLRRRLSPIAERLRARGWRWGPAVCFWLLVPVVWVSRVSLALSLVRYTRSSGEPKFDVLHVQESGWLAGLGVFLASRLGVPVICKEATAPALGPISYGMPWRRRMDRLRRRADAWAAQTETVRQELERLGLPPARLHLLPNGVALPADTASAANSSQVLYVGNLTQGAGWKGFDVLFEGWAAFVALRPEARLVFLGDGDPGPWQSRLRTAGCEHTVTFVGGVPDPSFWYRESGLFVLPSRIEGMSNALLEAQSWGLACIVSGIPGNLAVVEQDVNGRIVPVGDAAALTEALVRLYDDGSSRGRLGRAARARMESDFDIQGVCQRFARLYHTLAADTGACKESDRCGHP